MQKEKYLITGMTCSACSARVQRAVDKLPGVHEAVVNLLTNSMQIAYDEKQLSSTDIIQGVEKAGYGAALSGTAGQGAQKSSPTASEGENVLDKEAASMRRRLIWSIVCLLPLMYIAMHHMLWEWFGLPVAASFKAVFHGPENAITFAFAQFLLACPILLLNRKYFINGFRNLWQGAPNMDSLVGMGAAASVIFGIFAIFRMSWGLGHSDMALVEEYSQNLYFESAGMIVTLITVGKYLEARAKNSTGEALRKLMQLMPAKALVIRQGQELEIPVEELVVGEEIVVKPGGTIAADGVIISGSTTVDEAAITGESIPVVKNPGDKVVSATLNQNGYIHFRAERVGSESTISQIIQLVDEASSSKAPIAKIADKVAGVFVPAVIAIAILAGGIWLAMGATVEFAFSIAISILVISCPCALGLATPVAIMVGTGKGAQRGILIKSGEALEQAHHIDTVVLDKTGTITEGKPQMVDIIPLTVDKEELLAMTMALEKASQHPLAQAIIDYGKKTNVPIYEAVDFVSENGRGISGLVQGRKVYVGNAAYMEILGIAIDEQQSALTRLSQQGKTVLLVAGENQLLGMLAVADKEKSSSLAAVQAMQTMGLDVIMLTGDNSQTAQAVADRVGIDQVFAQILPQDKEKIVHKLQQQGKKVAMVGDGINDAPALARADVGIAIGAGTDIALESADVVLVGNDLLAVVDTIKLSGGVIRNIKENLFWAFIYNIIGIPLAAGLLYPGFGLKLSPMIGAAAMSMSSVCVVLNALRLKGFRFQHGNSVPQSRDWKEIEANENSLNAGKDEVKMKTELKIEGMMCQHCQKHVNDALSKMEGVVSVDVNLEAKTATVEADREISREEFKKVIEEAGYELV